MCLQVSLRRRMPNIVVTWVSVKGNLRLKREYEGWRNADVELTDKQLLDNIKNSEENV